MEQYVLERKNKLLNQLSCLPRKMLQVHGSDAVVDLVLHDLCKEDCLNLTKAVYVVDNPDFNCLKGVSGLCRSELNAVHDDVWADPHLGSQALRQTPFCQRVRQIQRISSRLNKVSDDELIKQIALEFNIQDPKSYSWDMKHDNHGILIYEKAHLDDEFIDEHLEDGVCLLSFCPVI